MYADDTTLYVTSDSVDSITTSLNHCLSLLNTWMQENYLKLDLSKTKCMIIHPPLVNLIFHPFTSLLTAPQ